MNREDRIRALRTGPDAGAADDITALFSGLTLFNEAAERLADAGYDVELGNDPGVPGLMTLGETADSPVVDVVFPLLTATIRREII